MKSRDIWITEVDLQRLLYEKLGRAHVVSATDVPPEVVTTC